MKRKWLSTILNQTVKSAAIITLLGTPATISVALSVAEPGTLDDTFGQGGKVLTTFAQFNDYAHAGALLPDGRIIAAGTQMLLMAVKISTLL